MSSERGREYRGYGLSAIGERGGAEMMNVENRMGKGIQRLWAVGYRRGDEKFVKFVQLVWICLIGPLKSAALVPGGSQVK